MPELKIENHFSSSFGLNNLFIFNSRRTKSTFALAYILTEVAKGNTILYISKFDMISDLENMYKEMKCLERLSSKIKSENLEDSIVITSKETAIEKLLDTQFKKHFDKIIYDEASMGSPLSIDLLKKIVDLDGKSPTIDIMKYQEDQVYCEKCTLQIGDKSNCIYFPEMRYINACIRVSFEESKPSFFFKKEKKFLLNRSLRKNEQSKFDQFILTLE